MPHQHLCEQLVPAAAPTCSPAPDAHRRAVSVNGDVLRFAGGDLAQQRIKGSEQGRSFCASDSSAALARGRSCTPDNHALRSIIVEAAVPRRDAVVRAVVGRRVQQRTGRCKHKRAGACGSLPIAARARRAQAGAPRRSINLQQYHDTVFTQSTRWRCRRCSPSLSARRCTAGLRCRACTAGVVVCLVHVTRHARCLQPKKAPRPSAS